jgi:hypothetical protein
MSILSSSDTGVGLMFQQKVNLNWRFLACKSLSCGSFSGKEF